MLPVVLVSVFVADAEQGNGSLIIALVCAVLFVLALGKDHLDEERERRNNLWREDRRRNKR